MDAIHLRRGPEASGSFNENVLIHPLGVVDLGVRGAKTRPIKEVIADVLEATTEAEVLQGDVQRYLKEEKGYVEHFRIDFVGDRFA